MADLNTSPPRSWRVVDLTSADYDCVAQRGRNLRALRVITPSGATSPVLTWREDGETADHPCPLVPGTTETFTGDFTHIRQTTINALSVEGAI